MNTTDHFALTDYLAAAMAKGRAELLDDGTYVGTIEACVGLLSFGSSEAAALEDLRYNLEDWVLVGLKLGAELPVFDGIDLNGEPRREPVDSLQKA